MSPRLNLGKIPENVSLAVGWQFPCGELATMYYGSNAIVGVIEQMRGVPGTPDGYLDVYEVPQRHRELVARVMGKNLYKKGFRLSFDLTELNPFYIQK